MATGSVKAAFVGSDLLVLSWAIHELENIITHDNCTLHTCLNTVYRLVVASLIHPHNVTQ